MLGDQIDEIERQFAMCRETLSNFYSYPSSYATTSAVDGISRSLIILQRRLEVLVNDSMKISGKGEESITKRLSENLAVVQATISRGSTDSILSSLDSA